MVIFNGLSYINGVLMAFLCFLMAFEYSSDRQRPVCFYALSYFLNLNEYFAFIV